MLIKDKYFIGFLAGVIAVIPMDIIDCLNYLLLKMLGYSHILYADYGVATLLHGQASKSVFEFISGQIFHMIFCGIVGTLYVFMLYLIREQSNCFKGWLCGIITWFIAFLSGVYFKIELFVQAEMQTVVSDLITSSIFGIFLALAFNKLLRKFIAHENG